MRWVQLSTMDKNKHHRTVPYHSIQCCNMADVKIFEFARKVTKKLYDWQFQNFVASHIKFCGVPFFAKLIIYAYGFKWFKCSDLYI